MSGNLPNEELPQEDDGRTARGPVASGKYAIVTIAILAVTLAGAAVYYQYRLQHRPLEFWGTGTATLLLTAPKVEALMLEPLAAATGETTDKLTADDRTWRIAARREISAAPGFSHVRRSLILGGSYDWNAPLPTKPIDWHYALVFRGAVPDGKETVVLFTADCDLLAPCEPLANDGSGHTVNVRPVAAGLRAFLEEQFASQQAPPEMLPADETSAGAEQSSP